MSNSTVEPTSTSITLARALQIRKRLAGRLTQVTTDCTSYNSYVVGQDEVNVEQLFKDREALIQALLDLKIALHKANVQSGVQAKVFQIGELRSEVTFLRSLNTRHGKFREYHATEPTEYRAHLRKSDVDKKVKALEVQIDDLQSEINELNASRKIDVPSSVVTLAR